VPVIDGGSLTHKGLFYWWGRTRRMMELVESIFNWALMECDPGLTVFNHKIRWMKFKKHWVIKSKFTDWEKIFAN
jgi:hypothetical protein